MSNFDKWTQRKKKQWVRYIRKAYKKYWKLHSEATLQKRVFSSWVETYNETWDENILEIEGFEDIRDTEWLERLRLIHDSALED